MTDNPAPAVYKVAELASLLDMGERQVREALRVGEIPGHKIGKQWRISKVAIQRWLEGDEPNKGTDGGAYGEELAQRKR